jgi:glycerol transport system substrate-binding protein
MRQPHQSLSNKLVLICDQPNLPRLLNDRLRHLDFARVKVQQGANWRVAWTPTGTNVPDYPKLAQLWWKNVATAVTGEKTPQAAMDNLADEMDNVLGRLQRAGMKNCPPKLNEKSDPNKWLSDKNAPWKKLANEKPKGETIAYEKLLQAWKEGRVK